MANTDMLNTLKGLLGDNADEKIGAVMSAIKGGNGTSSNTIKEINEDIEVDNSDKRGIEILGNNKNNSLNANNFLSPDGIEFMSRIKSILDEMGNANDNRSNLLMSLKPYMKETRKKSIDNAIKILNLSRMSGMFKI